MAEKINSYKKTPQNVKDLMKVAHTITEDVLKRVEESAKKYGAAYILADIKEELNQEVLDIVGWTLLEAMRIQLIVSNRLARLDKEYLKKFLKYHDVKYLKMLRDEIDKELVKRAE